MSVVARDRLKERVEQYADRNPDATLAEVLGRFLIDPDPGVEGDGEGKSDNDERALVEDVLAAADAPRDTADAAGGAKA